MLVTAGNGRVLRSTRFARHEDAVEIATDAVRALAYLVRAPPLPAEPATDLAAAGGDLYRCRAAAGMMMCRVPWDSAVRA